MKKRVLMLALSLVMACSLVACGGGSGTGDEKGTGLGIGKEEKNPVKKYQKQISYDAETGEEIGFTEITYDEKAREIGRKTGRKGEVTEDYTVDWKKVDGKEIGTYTFSVSNSEDIEAYKEVEYDADGNLIAYTLYVNGEVSEAETREYANGKLVSSDRTQYIVSNVITYTTEYDDKGNASKIIAIANDELQFEMVYTYEFDKDGEIIKYTETETRGEEVTEKIYEVTTSANGNDKKVTCSDGAYSEATTSDDEKLYESTSYDASGNKTSELTIEYY